jgi:hypothetical protein
LRSPNHFATAKTNSIIAARLEEPEAEAGLDYEPVDDGWPGYDEPTYT